MKTPPGQKAIDAAYKEAMSEAGAWSVYMSMQGEVIPTHDKQVSLSKDLKDEWGIPQLVTNIGYDENDAKKVKEFLEQGAAILQQAGCQNIVPNDSKQAPGLDIHEMGGARMGKDPATSILNKWNQVHSCNNVFVTDGGLHDVCRQSKSLPHFYGSYRLCGKPCR